MNYTELYTAIEDYTQNFETEFQRNIPVFVKQAEKRIYNTVQLPALRKNVTGSATAASPYVICPSDFLSAFSLAVIDGTGAYEYLLNKDVNFLRAAFPNPTETGAPQYYALFGPTSSDVNELAFIVAPTPDSNYTVELHYYYYPISIVDAGTSWLGDNYDPALLYASLVEAYTFMKGEADVMAFYDKKYNDALGQLKRLGDGLERGDAYRDGQAKVRVT